MTSRDSHTRAAELARRVTIAIVTALPKEQAAMRAMLDGPVDYTTGGRAPGEYLLGEIPAKGGGTHAIVLACSWMGENLAAANTAILLERLPTIEHVLMVGIAGAAPDPTQQEHDIHLGDVVVTNGTGVVQYDHDKEILREGMVERLPRHPPRPPGARLLTAESELQRMELEGSRPWEEHISRAKDLPWAKRPRAPNADVLHTTGVPKAIIIRRLDPTRRKTKPKVFRGVIASGNKLLKNPHLRDRLTTTFGAKAVEMEASGVADSAWLQGRGYFVVRGTCDYCDDAKNDRWQGYAAVIAAAYARALIERMRLEDVPHRTDLVDPPDAHELIRALESLQEQRRQRILAGFLTLDIDQEIAHYKSRLREGRLASSDDILAERFRLEVPLGEGSFSTVFRAWDMVQNRYVAVKVLHPRVARDESRLQRFIRGANIMKELGDHGAPAVVHVISEPENDRGLWFYPMELLPNGTLTDAVLAKAIAPEAITPLILDVGRALQAAHKRNFVHRDVKPENILLDANRRARLTDFDLVRAPGTTGGTGHSALGTFLYAAPEVVAGEMADERADVFSLAMTAVFALCGERIPPAAWRDASNYLAKTRLSPELQLTLVNALCWETEKRTPTVDEFCTSLSRAAQNGLFATKQTASVKPKKDLHGPNPMSMMQVRHPLRDRPYVGIDFGTSQSAIATFSQGRSRLIPNSDGTRFTPSVVAFAPDGSPVVGSPAVALAGVYPSRAFFDLKRKLGQNCRFTVDGKVYTCAELIALILAHLRRSAEQYLGQSVFAAILTHPAYFHAHQRAELLDAAHMAGFKVSRCLSEPTAAAFSSGGAMSGSEATVAAVYDLGGGTFDVSIVERAENVLEVISVCGDVALGGLDFDNRLIQLALSRVGARGGALSDERDQFRLRQAVEQAKIMLSSLDRAPIRVPALPVNDSVVDIEMEISRSEYRESTSDLVARTLECCKRALDACGLTPSRIDELVLVGLSTQTPFVREAVESYFGRSATPDVPPDAAVALGAARQGAVMEGLIDDDVLVDIIAHGVGLLMEDGPHTLLPPNTTIPTRKFQKMFASHEDETHIVLVEMSSSTPFRVLGSAEIKRSWAARPKELIEIVVSVSIDASKSLSAEIISLKDYLVTHLAMTGHEQLDPEERRNLPRMQA